MSQSLYSSLSLESNTIRLLRILPNENEEADINCTLFVYPLHDSGRGTHRYEALSYVWGDANNSRSICVNGHSLTVRANLHFALSRLRDPILDRIIWIDAICINQEDLNERGHQVQLMAKIYSKASQAVIWLGEAADNSDRALEGIVIAASQSEISSNSITRMAVLALVQRPWFRRIWVLQEVAAARHILIMCGLVEIDGYAFCSGLNLWKDSLEAYPKLQRLIRLQTFGPNMQKNSSDNFSLDIRPLSELIETYYTRESTDVLDKVYALLAMCSDNPTSAGLLPDYTILWEQLFQQLVQFILCKEIEVIIPQDRKKAIFKSKGCVLGLVSSVYVDAAWNDTQKVEIVFTDAFEYLESEMGMQTTWNIPMMEKNIQRGDIFCILQGVSKPTIIRLCDDYFSVIMIAATPMDFTLELKSEWYKILRSITTFPRDLLLAWDLGGSRKKLVSLESENLRVPINPNSMLEEDLETDGTQGAKKDIESSEEIRDSLEVKIHVKAESCSESGQNSEAKENSDSDEHSTAEEYSKAKGCSYMSENSEAGEHLNLDGYSETGSRIWDNAIRLRDVALILKDLRLYDDAEVLFLRLIKTRKQLQGVEHPQTLLSIADLQLYYQERGLLRETEELEAMKHLLETGESAAQVSEEEVVEIASLSSSKSMMLLLERRNGNIPITEEVVKIAAANYDCGTDIMKLLLREREDLSITENVVRIVAGNREGYEIMKLLFDKIEDFLITEEVVRIVAENKNEGYNIMKLLFDKKEDLLITEETVRIAAGNLKWGESLLELLFQQRGDPIPITREIIKEARGSDFNHRGNSQKCSRERALHSISNETAIKKRGDQIPITEETIKKIVGRIDDGFSVLELLFQTKGDQILITQEIVEAAADRFTQGYETMKFLLERKGDQILITEKILKIAAGNICITEEILKIATRNEGYAAQGMMSIFFERLGEQFPITEETLKEILELAATKWKPSFVKRLSTWKLKGHG
ncbi:uncharacterized protein EAF02_006095 [Botrytis sinoallii]|uniref:uncharacterized protein n=1 Tax=Botrytis sinoallii TaxID=1463999 RepID=UPI001902C1E6|nr:uncharacterized protein EAF02_006095 [Botrytis sinoallii]KAF7882732.1 hypothetical protein EAF02_006095 [Botrytis sinoallii]